MKLDSKLGPGPEHKIGIARSHLVYEKEVKDETGFGPQFGQQGYGVTERMTERMNELVAVTTNGVR